MKIIINKSTLQDFREKNMPATVTVSKSNIAFNNVARKILALKKGVGFTFEFDDNKLFYADGVENTFIITTENEKMVGLSATGIASFICDLLKIKQTKSVKFNIGDLKDGRRELTLV